MNFEASPFQRVFSGASGVDPYAAAISDVYQDLLGEGSFAGKGIYDVDAFEAALAGRVPEGSLLSHDLFEGIFARAGLASDVEVVEEFPARYDVASMRQHRWVRGDWQLLPWIFGRKDAGAEQHVAAAQPHTADRRMENAGQPAPLAVGADERGRAGRRMDAAARTRRCNGARTSSWRSGCRPCCPRSRESCRAARPSPCAATCARCAPTSSLALAQIALLTTMLAYQAWLMCDAIGRTLWRVFVTRRRMLEWVPADLLGNVRNARRFLLAHVPRRVGCARAGIAHRAGAWHAALIAVPFLILWVAAPAVAWRISRTPPPAAKSELSLEQQRELQAHRAPHLALLRDLRHRRRQSPAAGQFPGRSSPGHRAPDFAHQHRAVPAVHRRGPRLRLVRPARRARSHRDHARHAVADGQVPRPSLQLVRHQGPAAARAAIRVLGRLGQSRRPPDHARRRIPRVAAESTAPPEATVGLTDALDLAREALREFTFVPGQTITRELLETAFDDLEVGAAAKGRAPRSRRRTISRPPPSAPRHWSTWCARSATRAARNAIPISSTGWKPRAAPSTAGAAICWRAIRRDSSSSTWRAWRPGTRHSRAPWNSASCSTLSASCCRSAIAPPTARSIRPAMTCWPRKRGSRASSPSPRATCPRATGSGSDAR